jgi:hypothetical protein
MALIKSISGIRGTIGGKTGDNLTPVDIVKFTAAYGTLLIKEGANKKIIVGRTNDVFTTFFFFLRANRNVWARAKQNDKCSNKDAIQNDN